MVTSTRTKTSKQTTSSLPNQQQQQVQQELTPQQLQQKASQLASTTHTVIITPEQLQASIAELIKLEPVFLDIYQQVGMPELEFREQGFIALFNAIVAQQLSNKASRAIRDRLTAANLTSTSTISQVSDDTLHAHGLSRQKINYIRSLIEHQLDYQALSTMDDEEVITALTQVKGIGRWTAEIYLLFALNRADVCAHNDLAIKVACQHAFGLEKRPTEKQMQELAQAWSPHRSAASYLLWDYYQLLKSKQEV